MILQIIFALASVFAIANLTLGGSRLPPINDPVQVVADCQSLVEMKQRGELTFDENSWPRGALATEQWPSSITTLNPLGIYVYDNSVEILISTGGIDPCYGYYIPYLKQTNYNFIGQGRYKINNIYISKTQFQDIYSWYGIE